jgi:uncharacterized SAM-binding protein YcdF (DUF218 family)
MSDKSETRKAKPKQIAKGMRKKYKSLIGLTALLLIGTVFLTGEQILMAIGDFLVIEDDLQLGDLIHVIAGDDYRTDYAIKLFKKGYGKRIFFTGGWCHQHNFYHGKHGKERAVKQGIPIAAVAIDDSEVKSTYSEVVRLKEHIAQSQMRIRSVIVVSDPHHMRRARWSYKNVLEDKISIQMAPVPFELSPDKSQWWKDQMSRQYVKNEYLKFAYYIARYKLSFGPLKEWFARFDRK